MIKWPKWMLKKQEASAESKLVEDTKAKMVAERYFWDWVVVGMEPENETEAARAASTADKLLEMRRERFPE